MFIGVYELEGKTYNNIYFKCREGFDLWFSDTFSPTTQNIRILDFTIRGKNYLERKNNLEELAKDWQYNFSDLPWFMSELAEIGNYFYKNAKRYGLLQEFKENGIC